MHKVFEKHLVSDYLRLIQYANFKIVFFYGDLCCQRLCKEIRKLNYKKEKRCVND